MSIGLQNWAASLSYRAAKLHRPESIEQVQEIVARARRVKALGTRHSFSDIADTEGELISLEGLSQILSLDRGSNTVSVEGGVRYGELCRYLNQEGYALPNLASLPHISVAGACATGTHGSGNRNCGLASAVREIELVLANGTRVELRRESQDFLGAVVGLGGLGVVTRLTLDVIPAFQVSQTVYEGLELARLVEALDGGYSVSLFTDWQSNRFDQVWVKRSSVDRWFEMNYFGAKLADGPRHPIASMPAGNCTEQMGVPGPWHERLPHFRFEYTPSSGEELQSEYLVPREFGPDAVEAIASIRDRIASVLQISEIRTVAADSFWMSPCYQRDSLAIHFTWRKDWPAVRELLPTLEDRLDPFEARPHWGKLFTTHHERFCTLYERLSDFQSLLSAYDPEGKFRNAYIDRLVRYPTAM